MKKRYFLLLSLLTLSIPALAQENWVRTKIDEKVSVAFPSEPQKTSKNGNDIFIDREADSILYSAVMMDLKPLAGLDSAKLATIKDTQGFADQFMKGVASQKTNYEFGKTTIAKWKGFTSYETSAVDKNGKGTLYTYLIIIGSKVYTLTCRVPDKLSTKNKERFISSLMLQ
ncbi:hypothetical protein [Pedobacter aquatilis]|uniref:hypothetical protein n=1 Tax=Pedobacter aquatilis TaxID=351343 RepID=UPI002930B833|nr:hypothetical protein [Pedobacter aquatilis]